ncbi:OmpW family protein [Paracidovorax wautersii]|uniref:Outer membrane protein n=1 Tax=Paracidovorax wautersii TaxID=1177982 RepID=A0ABU1IEY7_9BURK|nr:OmpW family protein [Paracidovorax wautersii]MDR6215789.1 outer membrane protein [Paracidovorax wautersii]
MKKNLLAVAVLCAMTSGAAFAQQADVGPWQVRVRALHLDSDNGGSTNPNLGLSINDKTFPEFDISYFFSPNFAAELILTYPQKHDLRSNGALGNLGKIGSLKHLPPTLTAQYHFTNFGAFKPYVGAGVNYTRFSSVRFDPAVDAALQPSVKKNSFGGALQIGFDYALDKNWSLNFDVKKVYIKTDVRSAGTKVGTFKVDPLLVGVGVGYRF